MEKNMETLSDGLPRAARTRKEAMNANQSTDHARGAAAQREQARAKLMLALNCGVNDAQHATAFAQAAAACFERAAALAEARIIALTTSTETQQPSTH
jgi:hypothetical protein